MRKDMAQNMCSAIKLAGYIVRQKHVALGRHGFEGSDIVLTPHCLSSLRYLNQNRAVHSGVCVNAYYSCMCWNDIVIFWGR